MCNNATLREITRPIAKIPSLRDWISARLLREKKSHRAVTVPHRFGHLPCGCARETEQQGLTDTLADWHLERRGIDGSDLPHATFLHRECGKTFTMGGTGELKIDVELVERRESPYHSSVEQLDPLPRAIAWPNPRA